MPAQPGITFRKSRKLQLFASEADFFSIVVQEFSFPRTIYQADDLRVPTRNPMSQALASIDVIDCPVHRFLGQFTLGHGLLTLRPARPEDRLQIEAVAAHAFRYPTWLWQNKENRCHYAFHYPLATTWGEIRAVVAVNQYDRLAGYAYYQLRTNGELYLRELAAEPPAAADKVRRAGVALLAFILNDGLQTGWPGPVTLNVMADHHIVGPNGWRDPVPYYERFGFVVQDGVAGYTAIGDARPLKDIWMSADLAAALDRILTTLNNPKITKEVSDGSQGIRASGTRK
jgi:hypothetical protein